MAHKEPTWLVDFYDINLRQRLAWYRAKDESGAKSKLFAEWSHKAKIISIDLSDRTLEELNKLD